MDGIVVRGCFSSQAFEDRRDEGQGLRRRSSSIEMESACQALTVLAR